LDPVRDWFDEFSAYPTTRFPSPLTLPLVDPEPEITCRFTAWKTTVGFPPAPPGT
jgi:hypothetical protein